MVIRSRTVRRAMTSLEAAKHLYQCPDEQKPTPALLFGKLVHALVFDPASAELNDKHFAMAEEMSSKARDAIEHILHINLAAGDSEKIFNYQIGEHQVITQPDFINDDLILEYKTIASHKLNYKAYIKSMTYDVQIAFYNKFTPRKHWFFLFQEKIPPYPIRILEVSLEFMKEAHERMEYHLDKLLRTLDGEEEPCLMEVV